jgi:hypothetical protein
MGRKTPLDLLNTIAKPRALKEINQAVDIKLAALGKEYPERETQTWAVQLKEAEAYTADPASPTPFITAALSAGETVAQYAALVIANNAAWSAYAGGAVQLRRHYEAQVAAATTVDQVQAIIAEVKAL